MKNTTYISTSCLKAPKIKSVIEQLANFGFSHLELSGGTENYPELEQDIVELKSKLNIDLMLHNYFPPPTEHFVLNLASLNAKVFDQSVEHCLRAINLSRKIGATKFAIHAGFLIDIQLSEIGKPITKTNLFDRDKALEKYAEGFNLLVKETGNSLQLYVENNVLSFSNYKNYDNVNPFLFTDVASYHELKSAVNFKPLVDLAHLFVSCNTLGLNYIEQRDFLCQQTDYLHISDNDGLHDTNQIIGNNRNVTFTKENISNKCVTLEVYDELNEVMKSLDLVNGILNA